MIEIFNKLRKYNYWQGEPIKVGFVRKTYLGRIQKYLDNNLIKVLIGQRRVGKSYLMRQIIQLLLQQGINPKNIFYLHKEMADFDDIQNWQQLSDLVTFYKDQFKIQGKVYLLLDEVQSISGWEKIVNSLAQNYKEDYEIFLTGSNSQMLSSELATYLSGRYITFEILPFSFSEYSDFLGLPKNKENFLHYLKTGGLPQLYNLADDEAKLHYVDSLLDTILLKDVVERYHISDVYLLERIFKFLTDNIGNLFSVNGIVKFFQSHKLKTNFETVANYISYLNRTFLIHGVERFDVKGKALLAGNRKYFLNDLAFRNYLSSSFDFGLGKHLENYLYLFYKSFGYKIYVGKINGTEIDFVLEKNQMKKYVQAAYVLSDAEVINREFGSLEKISDSYEKIVISLDDVSLGNRNGIQHFCAWELEETF